MSASSNHEEPVGEWLEIVRQHVDSLQYGVVQITVHAHQVVQIERTEKVRITKGVAQVPPVKGAAH